MQTLICLTHQFSLARNKSGWPMSKWTMRTTVTSSFKPRGKISRRRFLWRVLGFAPVAAAADGFWCEPEWLRIRRFDFAQGKSAHRLVHFTDVHHKGDRDYFEKVVAQINALHPDSVCFTGDLVEEAAFVPEALEILGQIKAPLYGIPGNHDYWADADFDLIGEAFARTGGKWLMDETCVTPDGQVRLIGLTCTEGKSIAPQPGCRNVLLIHYPLWAEQMRGQRFDLMLAGHSHGGQVRLPFYGSLLTNFGVGQFEMGLYQTASGPLYVNPGIGYFYLNIRFCCRPELTVFEI